MRIHGPQRVRVALVAALALASCARHRQSAEPHEASAPRSDEAQRRAARLPGPLAPDRGHHAASIEGIENVTAIERIVVSEPIHHEGPNDSPAGVWTLFNPAAYDRTLRDAREVFTISNCVRAAADAHDEWMGLRYRIPQTLSYRCDVAWVESWPGHHTEEVHSVLFGRDVSMVDGSPVTWSGSFWYEFRRFMIFVKEDRFVVQGVADYDSMIWVWEAPIVRRGVAPRRGSDEP